MNDILTKAFIDIMKYCLWRRRYFRLKPEVGEEDLYSIIIVDEIKHQTRWGGVFYCKTSI